MQTTEPEERTRELEQPQEVAGVLVVAHQQRPYLLPQGGVLCFQLSCAFFWPHTAILRPLCKSA